MKEDKDKLIAIYTEKAKAALDDALFLINNKKYYIAVNRIYYSSFYMLTSLAIKNDFETSKHSQLIGWFNKNFIASDKIKSEYGKTVVRLFELRNKADYDIYASFTKEQTKQLYEDCKKLIKDLKKII